MPLVLPLEKISSNSMMVGCHTGIRLGFMLEPRLLAYMSIFTLVFLRGKRAVGWHTCALWL